MKNVNNLNLSKVLGCLLLLIMSSLTLAHAQAPDSKGTDYWVAFPGNYDGNSVLTLFITGDEATSGVVTVPGLSFSSGFTVTPGAITSVELPAEAQALTSNVVQNLGIHVTAQEEVTVYGLNRQEASTDAFLALPTDILGTEYINLGYENVNVYNATLLVIAGTANNTTVTINPKVATDGHAAGVPYNITLNQGQTYLLKNTGAAPSDLSGTVITSTKPVAVFGGHGCANIPAGAFACDYIVEQLPPTSAWGKQFVSIPLATRLNGDTFRFLASANNTSIEVNGAVVATLDKGQYHEQIIDGAAEIVASEAILVSQYSNSSSYDDVTSDPFMMLIPPFEQFLGEYTFTTPASGFSQNFVNVLVPTAGVGVVTLDGVPIPAENFTPIGGTGFSGAQLSVELGTHNLDGANYPVGAFVYGFDDYDSYGYPGGQSLSPIATLDEIIIALESGTTAPVGTEYCVTARATDTFGNPVAGVRVDFAVSGANTTTGFANTNSEGEAVFCYTGTNAGTDTIIATSGSFSDSAQLEFIESSKQPQTITFAPIPDKTFGDPPFALSATASSGLPVSFRIVSGPATVSGETVTLSGVGTVVVEASQGGNDAYNPAPPVTQQFTVSGTGTCNQAVLSFTLVNADTHRDIMPLQDGDVIDLSIMPTQNLKIKANTTPATVGSVVFDLDGAVVAVENLRPYRAGGEGKLTVGQHTLTATPYCEARGGGEAGTAMTLNFSVVNTNLAVLSFTLVNADTHRDIMPLQDGDVIDLAAMPTQNLKIKANTTPATVGSVAFELDGAVVAVENGRPYRYGGEGRLPIGQHTLTATPYSAARGGGLAGTALTLNFEVVGSASLSAAQSANAVGIDNLSSQIQAAPNPFSDQTAITFSVAEQGHATLEVYDMKGALVERLYQQQAEPGKAYTVYFRSKQLRSGVYITRLSAGKQLQHFKLVITR